MPQNSTESLVFIVGGATTGAAISATVGGMGLVGGFGGVSISMAPCTTAGVVAGAAVFGAFKAIETGDISAFKPIGIGALGGVGVYATVGGMGLAGSFGAIGIGIGTMAAAGGVVGLGVYGLYQACQQQPGQRMAGAIDAFARMETKVLEMDTYTQALLELELKALENNLLGDAIEQKFASLEMEQELVELKEQISGSDQDGIFSIDIPSSSEFVNLEIPEKIMVIDSQISSNWECVKILKGHQGSVHALAISPDGQTLVSGSEDKTVSLWDLRTGKPSFTFFGQSAEVTTVAISPDGKRILAGGLDNKITNWQLETKALLRPLCYLNSPYSHSGFVSDLVFSKDSKIIASASGDKTIRLWDGETGQFKRTFNGHSEAVFSVAISPDSQIIVSSSADQTIRIWSLTSFSQPRILRGHSHGVNSVVISPDGNILASGSTDGTIKLWNLHTGELLLTLDQHSSGVSCIAISPDGKTLASGSKNAVKVWYLETGELLDTLSGCSPVAFSLDGQILVSGGQNGTIKIWCQIFNHNQAKFDLMLSREWWEVLGVDKNADANTVKLAYRQLARQYHPDINSSSSAIAKMQAINNAYEQFLQEFGKVWL